MDRAAPSHPRDGPAAHPGAGPVGRRAVALVGLLAAFGAAGCDSGRADRAEQAIRWLQANAGGYMPGRAWRVENVRAPTAEQVEVDIFLADKAVADQIRVRTRIQQVQILQTACPAPDAEIWDILSSRQTLWLNLDDRAGNIISGSCRR